MKFSTEAMVEVAGKTAIARASLDLEAGVRLRTDQLEALLDSVRDALAEQVQQLAHAGERAELPGSDAEPAPQPARPPMPPYHFGINVEDVELAKARFVEEHAGKPYEQTYGPMEQDLRGQAVRWVPPSVFAAAVVEHPGLESPAGERCVVCDGRGRLLGSFGHAPKCAHCNGEGSLVAMPITGPGGDPWVKPAAKPRQSLARVTTDFSEAEWDGLTSEQREAYHADPNGFLAAFRCSCPSPADALAAQEGQVTASGGWCSPDGVEVDGSTDECTGDLMCRASEHIEGCLAPAVASMTFRRGGIVYPAPSVPYVGPSAVEDGTQCGECGAPFVREDGCGSPGCPGRAMRTEVSGG